MTIGSLFSGIGGLELGLERAGLGPVVWQVENDPFCRKVLEKHWPDVDRSVTDVREAQRKLAPVELICGGFPCQDVSDASHGRGKGLEGHHSGLWKNMVELVDELKPKWVIVENVAGAATRRWVPRVREDLHTQANYASVPVAVSAAQAGAPFARDRIFVLAVPYSKGKSARALHAKVAELSAIARPDRHWRSSAPWHLGVDDGVPHGMDRRRALGNAVVPQVAEVIGRLIA